MFYDSGQIVNQKIAMWKTYVDEIQAIKKRRNSPSPNHYKIKMGWPDKSKKAIHASKKINFLDHSEL